MVCERKRFGERRGTGTRGGVVRGSAAQLLVIGLVEQGHHALDAG